MHVASSAISQYNTSSYVVSAAAVRDLNCTSHAWPELAQKKSFQSAIHHQSHNASTCCFPAAASTASVPTWHMVVGALVLHYACSRSAPQLLSSVDALAASSSDDAVVIALGVLVSERGEPRAPEFLRVVAVFLHVMP
jgi:hypothetical protein